jgi:hypothetical protein
VIITSTPEWANFRPIGTCFLLAGYRKLHNKPKCLRYFLQGNFYVLILTKDGLGCILGDFFTNSSGHLAGKQVNTQITHACTCLNLKQLKFNTIQERCLPFLLGFHKNDAHKVDISVDIKYKSLQGIFPTVPTI